MILGSIEIAWLVDDMFCYSIRLPVVQENMKIAADVLLFADRMKDSIVSDESEKSGMKRVLTYEYKGRPREGTTLSRRKGSISA